MRTKPRFLMGDTHCMYDNLFKQVWNIRNVFPTAQIVHLGDINLDEVKHPDRPWPDDFHFIAGNHDNFTYCAKDPRFLGKFGVFDDMFFVSGGHTPPHMRGAPFVYAKIATLEGTKTIPPYWPDEEPTMAEADQVLDLYKQVKPEVVITHDCPAVIKDDLFGFDGGSGVIGCLLDAMFAYHQPRHWFFGHFHVTRDETINGTRFFCIGECQYKMVPGDLD